MPYARRDRTWAAASDSVGSPTIPAESCGVARLALLDRMVAIASECDDDIQKLATA